MADRTIVLAQNKRHAVRGVTVVNPQEFSAYQEDNDDLTYIVDMSSYLDGATISSVTRTPTGVTVSNTSNTTTRLTQRLKGFGYVDFKVTTSSGDVEEFRISIQSRTRSIYESIAAVPEATVTALTANRTYYVRTDGSDTNDGLSNSASGAFATLQKALDVYAALDLAGFAVTIQLGSGTHTTGGTLEANPQGAFATTPLTIVGDTATPSNVIISTTSASCIVASDSARLYVEGVKLTTTTSGVGLLAVRGGEIKFGNVDFGSCAGFQKEANDHGRIYNNGNYSISGGAVAHEHCNNQSYILNLSATVTITGTPAFSSYFVGVASAQVQYVSVTYSGSATGQRFLVHQNGVITAASQSLTYLPGNAAGVIDTGGCYTGEGGTAYITAGPSWSSSNFGLALAIGGSKNNCIGIRDATGSNPWAIANTSGSLSFAKMEAFYGVSSPPDFVLRLISTGQIRLKTFTVATLPAASAGDVSFATNGRKNGEGAGLGTGVLVFYDGTAWRACDTGATVAA